MEIVRGIFEILTNMPYDHAFLQPAKRIMSNRTTIESDEEDDVWPALADTMLAFLLVMVLLFSFQVARNMTIRSNDIEIVLEAIDKDQQAVRDIVTQIAANSGDVRIKETDVFEQEITLGADALFPSGSADLSQEGERILSRLVSEIAAAKIGTLKEITVKGHTDSTPTSSTSRFESNWELSTSRATRIVRKLIGEDGGLAVVDPTVVTLVASGYGSFQTIDIENMDENRRIEIRLVYTNPNGD